ncbi:MAG: hypothetical protein OQL27_00340 [Sedimenticola sp.]|nr:hypothetical protein [Sedimenticola sp.]
MKQHNSNQLNRQRIAEFISLSADYIGVKPPSEHTFARWTAHCSCQPSKLESRLP